jgi:hypothetical protein
MLQFTKAIRASDGAAFFDLDDAQCHELKLLFVPENGAAFSFEAILEKIVAEKEKVIDILTTTPRSRPKARSLHGGKKNRKPKLEVPNT